MQSLASEANVLYLDLWTLRDTFLSLDLIDPEKREEIDNNLVDLIRYFYFYSRVGDMGRIITVAGPQGVGKSTLINNMLGLKNHEKLPTGEGRGETLPIVVLPKTESRDSPEVVIFKKSNGPDMVQVIEQLSYSEARNRLTLTRREEDLIAFWYIADNPLLKRISPLIMLPGLELDTLWAHDIKAFINLSDVILLVTDSSRSAQSSAATIETWIKEAAPPVPPIVVGSFADTMSKEDVISFKEFLMESKMKIANVVMCGINGCENPGPENLPYSFLFSEILQALTRVPVDIKNRNFRKNLHRVERVLKQIEKSLSEQIKENLIDKELFVNNVIKKIQRDTDKLKEDIMDQIEKLLSQYEMKAIDRAREIRRREFKWIKKFSIVLLGLSVDKIINIEDEIKKTFISSEFLRDLDEILQDYLFPKLPSSPHENTEDVSGNIQSLDWNFYPVILSTLLVSPNDLLDVQKELVSELRKKGEITQETYEVAMNGLKRGQEIIDLSPKNPPPKMKRYRKTLERNLKSATNNFPPAVRSAINSLVMGATGIIEVWMEAVGAGLPGATLTTLGVIMGTAFAAAGAVGFTTSVVATGRKVEWEVDTYIRRYADVVKDELEARFFQSLNKTMKNWIYWTKKFLLSSIGEDFDMRAIITLQHVKNIREHLRKLEAKLW